MHSTPGPGLAQSRWQAEQATAIPCTPNPSPLPKLPCDDTNMVGSTCEGAVGAALGSCVVDQDQVELVEALCANHGGQGLVSSSGGIDNLLQAALGGNIGERCRVVLAGCGNDSSRYGAADVGL